MPPQRPALPARGHRSRAAAWLVLGLAYTGLVLTHQFTLTGYRIDLDVYRIGSEQWLHGRGLYGSLPVTSAGLPLPFTYPPVAAVVLAPLALVPYPVASLVVTLLGLATLVVTLRLVLAATSAPPAWREPATFALLVATAVALEPVRQTLGFGQVNLLLMAAGAADCLSRRTRWPRGLLLGLAAAVKLTPAVLVLFLLLRGDRRAARTAVVTALVATAAGFVLARADSVGYWTHTLYDTGRIGSASYAGNQSLTAVLARLGLGGAWLTAAWLALCAVALLVAVRGIRRELVAGRPAVALSVAALLGLLVSPVSWSHHWVWGVPAILALTVHGRRDGDRARLGLAWVGLVIFAISPQWLFPHGHGQEGAWPLVAHLFTDSYVWWAVAVLAVVAFRSVVGRVLVGAVPGRLDLEGRVLDVEVLADAGGQQVEHAVGTAGDGRRGVDDHVG